MSGVYQEVRSMTRSHLDGNPFAPDSRYPNLFVGSRVTKFPPHEPELGGKVIKYDFGAGCPWVVEWDREVRFKPPNWEHVYRSRLAPSVSRIHVHLGEELQHEHACIICEHGGHQVDQTHACMCGAECEWEEWRTP